MFELLAIAVDLLKILSYVAGLSTVSVTIGAVVGTIAGSILSEVR